MQTAEKIIEKIKALPVKEYRKIRDWIADKEWQEWDTEITRDSNSGKLDFLIDEALREKGNLKEL